MRTNTKAHPVAILCADIHLSVVPPTFRSKERDWFTAMARPLVEIAQLKEDLGVPILCAGDVFDRWNSPPALVNFALDHLPTMHAVAGQHDLPYHDLSSMDACALGTLVRVGKIRLLHPDRPNLLRGLYVWGFSWRAAVVPQDQAVDSDHLCVAVVHRYIWDRNSGHPGAAAANMAACSRGPLEGYQVAVYGDNHKHFETRLENETGTLLWNCGTLMRRKRDERDPPRLGILYSDGTIKPHPLKSAAKEVFTETDPDRIRLEEESQATMEDFIRELKEVGATAADLPSAMKDYLRTHDVSPRARALIAEAVLR